ncbi:MAG: MMPL family transporter [Propionibacteriaceae bacterium]
MSSFLYRVGRAAYRRRGRTLIIWLLVVAVIGTLAATLSKPFDDGFELPGTQSQEALDSLALTFPQVSGSSAQVVVVAPAGASVRDAETRTAVATAVDRLEALPQVDSALSPYDKNISGAINDAGTAAVINVQLNVGTPAVTDETKQALQDTATTLQADLPGSQTSAGGAAYAATGISLSVVEALGVLIAMIVLMLTLGSFRAAGMPLLTALLGVGISMALIIFATALIKVSSSTPLLALMLGLAVGIDYALFIVSRHRDQLATGLEAEESVARAVATAGSAVVFAGLTVMIALVGLSVAGIPFLATMGVAAAISVAIAVLIALTLLPALLGFAGDRLRPKVKRARSPQGMAAGKSGPAGHAPEHAAEPAIHRPKVGWAGRWVGAATKFPVLTIVIIVVALGALALPAQSLRLALPDNGSADAGTPARVTYDLLSKEFGPGYNGLLIVTADIVGSDDPLGVMNGIKDRIEELPGVAAVPLATPNQGADTGIVQVVPTTAPDSEQTADLVRTIRGLAPEFTDAYGVDTAVTGITAIQIDVSSQLGKALLPFGILVVGLSLILLTMVFRSIAVPIKATLGYLLSVGASFGAVSLVFVHGFLNGPLNIEHSGPVLSFLPILLMGILFGLAMDYEVFLVSRIREDYVHGGDARQAVHTGFTASAKVVVAAGVIMFSVFAAFVPEGESIIKSIALGLAVGIFVDAFLVRMTLVPAVLVLLGDKAWYLPRWLDRLLPSFDVEGEALAHQLSLADWPSPDSAYLVAASELRVDDRHGRRVTGGSLFLAPGQVGVVESADPAAGTALLLALVGRLKIAAGQVKIAELVLPEQAGQLRRRAVYLDAADQERFPAALARVGRAEVVVVDHVDRIDVAGARALGRLVDQAAAAGRAIVLATDDAADVAPLVPTGSPLVTLSNHSSLSATSVAAYV